jgi:ABC-type uncharacterized transport system substrate-binding protein
MKNLVYILILVVGIPVLSCNRKKKSPGEARIFYVNSYHAGYGSSDDVMSGIKETFADEKVELSTFFLDAKRRTSVPEIQQSVRTVLNEIEKYKPDLLIVSDDNVVKDLVVPYFNNTNLPVVFCGVNRSAEQYNLGGNVTGMLEVLPLRELFLEVISNYPESKKLVVLSENSLSEQNNKTLLDTLYRNLGLGVKYSFAPDFTTWKEMFLDANETTDLIYMPTNGAIKNWDEDEAIKFVNENLKIPAITCDDFMMPYVVFGLTKVAKEQGQWAAKTAMEILNGQKPSEIPFTKNSQAKAYINTSLAEKIDFRLTPEMRKKVNNY